MDSRALDPILTRETTSSAEQVLLGTVLASPCPHSWKNVGPREARGMCGGHSARVKTLLHKRLELDRFLANPREQCRVLGTLQIDDKETFP